MRIYIAGPMRGKKWFNFPEFDWAKEYLMRAGWEVISPADLDREIGFDVKSLPPDTDWNDVAKLGFDLKAAVQRDVAAILSCDAIFMLHGWSESRGAKAEKAVAEWRGLMVFYQVDGYPKVSEVNETPVEWNGIERYPPPAEPQWIRITRENVGKYLFSLCRLRDGLDKEWRDGHIVGWCMNDDCCLVESDVHPIERVLSWNFVEVRNAATL